MGPGLQLLGPVKQKFLQVCDTFDPLDDGTAAQLFISKSYDATSHFQSTCADVLDIFKRGTGQEFDFSNVKHTLEDQEWRLGSAVSCIYPCAGCMYCNVP